MELMKRRKRKTTKKKTKKLPIILILLILVVVLGGYFLVYRNGAPLKGAMETITKPEKKLQILDLDSDERPIAVMIDNNVGYTAHAGLQDAYLTYEIIVEGGLTRLMAIFKDQDTELIGPVRSARHYFLDYALENDAIYVHYGWSPQAQEDISDLGVNNINGIYESTSSFWRVTDKYAPHNAVTSTKNIMEIARREGYRTTTNSNPVLNYVVDEVNLENGQDANTITIPYSTVNTVRYEYDETAKEYVRYSRDEKQVDWDTKQPVTTKNIIIEKVENSTLNDGTEKGRQTLDNIGEFDGYYITNGKAIEIKGATEHNLKNINVKFPLGQFICVTGVSGSGKSSLVNEIIYKQLAKDLNGARTKSGKHKAIKGIENIDKIVDISQSPIGRTPRSNPATYTGVFTDIRELFAMTADAKTKGYSASRFSFNVKGGRCEACQGDGIVQIAMHFLPDIFVPCDVCNGKRYNRETLEVKYKGKTIADVLDMTVEEALHFFSAVPKISRRIQTLYDVGLGYIKLGQPATTLSGGEAQRVKLATELSRRSTGKTLYILDEPTTGLHTADVHRLIDMLNRLVEGGNSVLVIEHNLDVIKTADYIIDMGPDGGDRGGTVVAQGTPEQVALADGSYTGYYLRKMLE